MAAPREIVFVIGDRLPGDIDSGSFAGYTFEEIRSDLEKSYQLEEPFDVLVNDELVSREYVPLDGGDEVRIVLHRASGRGKDDNEVEAEAMPGAVPPITVAMPGAVPPITVDLLTNEATVRGGRTYQLDRTLILILDVLIKH
jgi:hypothetical protein